MPYGALVTGQSLQNQYDSLSDPLGEARPCLPAGYGPVTGITPAPSPLPACRLATWGRQRDRAQVLQLLCPERKCQKVELDPIYKIIFFVSCCPLLSQTLAAPRELPAAELQGWRSRIQLGATARLVTPRHENLPLGEK